MLSEQTSIQQEEWNYVLKILSKVKEDTEFCMSIDKNLFALPISYLQYTELYSSFVESACDNADRSPL